MSPLVLGLLAAVAALLVLPRSGRPAAGRALPAAPTHRASPATRPLRWCSGPGSASRSESAYLGWNPGLTENIANAVLPKRRRRSISLLPVSRQVLRSRPRSPRPRRPWAHPCVTRSCPWWQRSGSGPRPWWPGRGWTPPCTDSLVRSFVRVRPVLRSLISCRGWPPMRGPVNVPRPRHEFAPQRYVSRHLSARHFCRPSSSWVWSLSWPRGWASCSEPTLR